jgi:hypothetical protein
MQLTELTATSADSTICGPWNTLLAGKEPLGMLE